MYSDNSETPMNQNRNLGEYNGEDVILKNGKYGMYVTIDGKNTSVKYINKDMDDITLEDVVEYIKKRVLHLLIL